MDRQDCKQTRKGKMHSFKLKWSNSTIEQKSKNPDDISWLHIDLNSSYATKKALEFFYEKIEKNGIILFDDYAHDSYEDTRIVIEEFFKDKKINFLQLMTGQVIVTKKEWIIELWT